MDFLKKIFRQVKSTDKITESQTKFVNIHKPDFDSIRDFGQIQSIFEWVFNTDTEVATSCAQTIHRLLTKQTTFKNKTLYNSLRHIYLREEDLEKFDKFEVTLKLSLLNIASMNSSGYIREKALDGLLANSNQFTFPYIIFRLSDWVPRIKSKAEKAIKDIIRKEEPEFLIKNHGLIDWLLKIERSDLSYIHNDIIQFIFSDSNIERIVKSIDKYSDGDRFFIFRNLIQKGKLQSSVYETILSDKNHLIRLLAIRNIEFIDNPELTKRLLNDRSQKIRFYAINKISRSQIDKFKSEVYQLLFDMSSGIRAEARLILTKIEKYNFPQIYKEELIKKPDVGCIIGLAEVGNKNDIEIIKEFLKSKSVKLRAASLFAISLLDYDFAKKLAIELLNDSSNIVKKTCCTIIQKEISAGDIEELRIIYDSGQNETKRFILKIIGKYGGWSIAGDFLQGIMEPDSKVRETSFALLHRWYRYSTRLGITQQTDDKQYVMNIYNMGHFDEIKLPTDIDRIIKEIPFIFSENKK